MIYIIFLHAREDSECVDQEVFCCAVTSRKDAEMYMKTFPALPYDGLWYEVKEIEPLTHEEFLKTKFREPLYARVCDGCPEKYFEGAVDGKYYPCAKALSCPERLIERKGDCYTLT